MGLGIAAQLDLIVDAPAPGAANMERDLELLDRVLSGAGGGTVRIYGFSPACLSLGRSQSAGDVDRDACSRDGVDVVRRPTGGRAVLHDAEVTYSVTCKVTDPMFGGSVMESYARIHSVVTEALTTLQVRTVAAPAGRRVEARHPDCFAHPAAGELLDVNGNKLVGSAQARRAGALLQHGSVLLGPPRAARYLRMPGLDEPVNGGLSGLLGRPVAREEVVDALAGAFRQRRPHSPK